MYPVDHRKMEFTSVKSRNDSVCYQMLSLAFSINCKVAASHEKQSHYRSVLQERHGLPYFREDRNAVEYGLPFTTTSFAIALLLVFRTNESYRRWVVQVFILFSF